MVVIREGDDSRKVSKQRALVTSMLNRGIKGDARSTSLSISTLLRLFDVDAGAAESDEDLSQDELEILKAHVDAEIERRSEESSTDIDSDKDEEDSE